MHTTYWITIQTDQVYPMHVEGEGSFDWVAGHLSAACESVFTSCKSIRSLTHSDEITETGVELEVRMIEPESLQSPVVARLALDIDAPGKVALDKHRLSAAIRSHLPFAVKVLKRVLSPEEVAGFAD